jgi:hypothetical protein
LAFTSNATTPPSANSTNRVDLVVVARPPVTRPNGLVQPGDLLAKLPDDERSQEVPELARQPTAT